MHRTTIVLSENERVALESIAEAEGASVELVIRRILDAALGLDPNDASNTFEFHLDLTEDALAAYRRRQDEGSD